MLRLALKMLLGERGKYLGIVTGITLSSILMIQQPGIMLSMFSQICGFINEIGLPDIWVMDPNALTVDDAKAMQDTQLNRVRGIQGVAWAVPLYRGTQTLRLSNGETTSVNIIGIDDATLIGGPAVMVDGKLLDLRTSDAIIVDDASTRGKLAMKSPSGGASIPLKVGDTVEIHDYRARVVGLCRASRGFQSTPTIYTTYDRAKTFAGTSERKLLSYVLVKAKNGESPQILAQRIARGTGLGAYTKAKVAQMTLDFMIHHTSIIMNFGFVVVIGFVVGAAVTGQIFYNFTLDNLRHFGVLKAMGTTDATLRRMILLQALLVGCVGFGLGVGICAAFSLASSNADDLSMKLNWQLLLCSGLAVLLIVLGAALLSLRKVLKLEPAVVFKG